MCNSKLATDIPRCILDQARRTVGSKCCVREIRCSAVLYLKNKMADEVSPEPENCNQFFLDFRRVIDYVEAHRHLIDAHMVDFFTSNHWETLVTPELRKDLLKLSEDELCSLHSIEIEDSRKTENFGETILDFVRQARRSQLGCFSWVKERREYASGKVRDFISHVMAPKKAYEVETMADVVYTLSRKYVSPKVSDGNAQFSESVPRIVSKYPECSWWNQVYKIYTSLGHCILCNFANATLSDNSYHTLEF